MTTNTDKRLRALTWNVWWRFGPWQDRQPAIAATLRAVDADVIALQEVWADGTANHAAELASMLGYHHVYAQSMEMNGLGFGNAILSRWPIADTETVELFGHAETEERRVALFAEIDGPRGKIPMFCTHLNWKHQHSHIRQRQVADVARLAARHSRRNFPPVLCGDFNAEPMSEEIRMLRGLTTCPVEDLFFHDAWAVAGDGGPGLTWDNRNAHAALECEPDRRIDYLFVGAARARRLGHVLKARLVGDAPVDGVWPSDHIAVLAELKY